MKILKLFSPNVPNLESKRNVQGLIKALNYKKAESSSHPIRSSAAVALGNIGSHEATDALLSALEDYQQRGIRREVIIALGKVGDSKAIGPLVHLLQYASSLDDYKDDIVHSLLSINPVQAANRLVEQFQTAKHNPKLRLLEAMVTFKTDVVVAAVIKFLQQPRYIMNELDTLSYGGLEWISIAARILGDLGDASAIDPLVNELAHLGSIDFVKSLSPQGPRLKPWFHKAYDFKYEWAKYYQNQRRELVTTLSRLGWQPTPDSAGVVYWIETQDWQKCLDCKEVAIEPLILTLLFSRDQALIEVASKLAQLGAPAAEALVKFLCDPNPYYDGIYGDFKKAFHEFGILAVPPLIAATVSGAMAHTDYVTPSLKELLNSLSADDQIYAIASLMDSLRSNEATYFADMRAQLLEEFVEKNLSHLPDAVLRALADLSNPQNIVKSYVSTGQYEDEDQYGRHTVTTGEWRPTATVEINLESLRHLVQSELRKRETEG